MYNKSNLNWCNIEYGSLPASIHPTGMPKQAFELPQPSKILLLLGMVRILTSVVGFCVVVVVLGVVVVDVVVVVEVVAAVMVGSSLNLKSLDILYK